MSISCILRLPVFTSCSLTFIPYSVVLNWERFCLPPAPHMAISGDIFVRQTGEREFLASSE